MTIVQRMREELRPSMKARDAVRTQFLRYWIAQLTLGTGAEVADAEAVKRMRGVLKEAKSGQTTWKPEEIALIQEWVPASLGPAQIAEALAAVSEQIKAAPAYVDVTDRASVRSAALDAVAAFGKIHVQLANSNQIA